MIISERIFRIMEERGMTQMGFSESTGISQSTISDWKRKKTNPSSDKIMKICEVLEITPYELLQDTLPESGSAYNRNYRVVSEGTETYSFLMEYDELDRKGKDRLFGYLLALRDANLSEIGSCLEKTERGGL